ncbi:MAG: PLP-dependent transferase [Actinobacteria bacterium]|nr:MAG: PLP-dependent transferase [Actinomycetota bacterium]
MRFKTKAVHLGQEKDPAYGATIPPIYLSSTYTHENLGKHKGYEYCRSGNPTRASLEGLIAGLEQADYGLAFASGMAAAQSIFSLLDDKSHVILSQDVYGGTYRLVSQLLPSQGIECSLVDTTDITAIMGAIKNNTKLILIETPTNPLLKIMDIKAIKKAVGSKILLVVDNTFATPYYQTPLKDGADIVFHSSTKYLSGHSDVVGGLVVVNDKEIYEKLKFIQNTTGAVPSPFDCYLTIRGIKTLPLRMEAHSSNAQMIADYLKQNPKSEIVYYPGYSGIVSFRIKGGLAQSKKFLESLKLFSLAESLGGVESLASLPAKMTHATFSQEQRNTLGITENLIRLSVGIEDIKDLISDIKQALSRAS